MCKENLFFIKIKPESGSNKYQQCPNCKHFMLQNKTKIWLQICGLSTNSLVMNGLNNLMSKLS